jgi:hypothetical protein
MAKFGQFSMYADGETISGKSNLESDITTSSLEAEPTMDGGVVILETPKVAMAKGTIQIPPGKGVNDFHGKRGVTFTCKTGHLRHIYPDADVTVKSALNEKGEISIEVYARQKPIEEIL